MLIFTSVICWSWLPCRSAARRLDARGRRLERALDALHIAPPRPHQRDYP